MMKILKNKKFLFIGLFVGLIGGFVYWKYVGCLTGNCAIQSNAYLMTGYGALMGLAVGNIVQTYTKS